MRDFFVKDWAWKLFSLVLAVVIWLVIFVNRADLFTPQTGGTHDTVTWENMHVTIVASGADVHQFKAQPAAVAVVVTGAHNVISDLQEKEVHATVDVSDMVGERRSREPVRVSAPPGVALLKVTPPVVEVIAPPAPATP